MNVIWAESQDTVFENIKPGDCFIVKKDHIYMKTSDNYHAVNLEDGYLTQFENDDIVIPTYAEIYVTKGENNGQNNKNTN